MLGGSGQLAVSIVKRDRHQGYANQSPNSSQKKTPPLRRILSFRIPSRMQLRRPDVAVPARARAAENLPAAGNWTLVLPVASYADRQRHGPALWCRSRGTRCRGRAHRSTNRAVARDNASQQHRALRGRVHPIRTPEQSRLKEAAKHGSRHKQRVKVVVARPRRPQVAEVDALFANPTRVLEAIARQVAPASVGLRTP